MLCYYEFVIQLETLCGTLLVLMLLSNPWYQNRLSLNHNIEINAMQAHAFTYHKVRGVPGQPGLIKCQGVMVHFRLQNNSVMVLRPPPHCYVSVKSALMYLTHIFDTYFTQTFKDSGFCPRIFSNSQDNSVFWLNPITPNSAWQLALCNHVSEVHSISNTSTRNMIEDKVNNYIYEGLTY